MSFAQRAKFVGSCDSNPVIVTRKKLLVADSTFVGKDLILNSVINSKPL